MKMRHRILTLLGGAGAALLAGFGSAALAHADAIVDAVTGGPYQTCDSGACLVMGQVGETNWSYSGIRPLFTDWQGDQPYTVQLTQGDGSTIDAGSYAMTIQDYWSPIISVSQYHYGDFTPSDAAAGADLGSFADMSGASIYKSSLLNGLVDSVVYNNVQQHGHEMTYIVTSMGDYTNILTVGGGGSGDYFQIGDGDPTFLWNSLDHTFPAVAPDYLIPADPFAGLDFNPNDFLGGAIAGL